MPRHFLPVVSLGLGFAAAACAPAPDSNEARQRQMFGLLEKFDRFDENGDGFLSRRELEAGAQQVGAHFTSAEFDRIMTNYDRNRDGRISLAEAQSRAAEGPGGG